MRKIVLLLVALITIGNIAFAQKKAITGKVADESGNPIPFATVTEKGTQNGASADEKGNFTITASSKAVLVISATGFASQQVKATDNLETIKLIPAKETTIDEVVVTALGIRKNRNTLPYAAQQVEGAELTKTGTLNPVNALSGKVAGLQITQSNTMGGSTNVILRGIKSLTQSNQALFVIDGVPYDNSNQSRSSYDLGNVASDLNADDIASISVLKGAAASALYGARATNGVIMITTKKGRKNSGVGVSVITGISVGSVDNSTLPVYQTEYGQGFGTTNGSFFYNLPIFNSNGQKVPIVQTNNDAALGPKYDPNLMVYNWDAFVPGSPNYGKATPWVAAKHNRPQDYFVTPVTTSAGITVSGGGDRGTFRLGFRHDDQKDFMPNSSLKKNDVSANMTYDLVKNLTVGVDADYSNNKAVNRSLYPYTGGTSPMTDFRQWWPTNVDVQEQKDLYYHSTAGQVTNATWNWQTGAYMNNVPGKIGRPAYHDNLYWFSNTNFENDSRDRVFGNVHVNYKLGDYINITGRVSKDFYSQAFEIRQDVGSQSTASYNRYDAVHDEVNYDLFANFKKDLTNDLNLFALVGVNKRTTLDRNIAAGTNGGLVVPGLFSLANSVKTPAAPVENYQTREVDGVYGQVTLGYRELLTLDGTLRRDQSSTLPVSNNSYYYPSVAFNFQFGKLLSNLEWLSRAKAWTNYAEVSADAPIYSLVNTYGAQTPFNGQTMFAVPATNNNPKLIPERTKGFEVGLEASLFKERASFTVTKYTTKTVNQIMPTSVSTSTGFSTFYVNGGTIQNSGLEVSVNVVPVRTKDFTWSMDVNWSNNKQKVLTLYNNQPSYVVASYQNSIRLTAVPGQSYQLQGTDYVYKNGQRLIDANGYPVIADNAYSNLGSPFPDWRGGVNNTLRYKRLALSFLVDVSKGGSVYSLDMDYGSSSGLYPRTAGLNDLGNPVRDPLTNDSKSGGIIFKGVTADGKPNTVRVSAEDANNGMFPFSSANNEADREFVYDASYVKLREVNLTYSLPHNVFGKAQFIKGIDVSLMGKNLWIIHKNLPYADPEQGQASGNASMGFQNGAYPTVRYVGCMLKFNF